MFGFCAHLAKLSTLGDAVRMNDSLAALYLLAIANTLLSQRLSILAAASPKSIDLTPRTALNDFLASINYETIASILRQCNQNESHSALWA